jgi:hypothetical protein
MHIRDSYHVFTVVIRTEAEDEQRGAGRLHGSCKGEFLTRIITILPVGEQKHAR